RPRHRCRQPALRTEAPRHVGMMGEHVIHLAVSRERELEAEAETMHCRVAGAESPHARRRGAEARCMRVLDGFHGDVVAKPLRLLMGSVWHPMLMRRAA